MAQEQASLLAINYEFRKIIIVNRFNLEWI